MARDILITPGSSRIDFSGLNDQTLYLYVEDNGDIAFKKDSDDTQQFRFLENGTFISNTLSSNDVTLTRNDGTAPGITVSNFDYFRFITDGGSNTVNLGVDSDNDLTINGSKVLTVATEGSGNGIDADTLDGQEGAWYQDLTNATGTLADARLSGSYNVTSLTTSLDLKTNQDLRLGRNDGSAAAIITENFDYIRFSGGGYIANLGISASHEFYIGTNTANKIWHAGNDGAGSGLNADTVDGVHLSGLVQTDREIAAGVGLSGGGTLGSDRTLNLDISSLNSTTAIASADLLAFEDVTDGGHHSRTLANVISDLGILTTTDEGSGNGIDADTVDSLEASQFLRSDTADTATGTIDFSGRVQVADGAANAPFLTFTSDTNTGTFKPGDNIIGFATGGVERVRISNGGIGIINGTESAPSLRMTTDANTGLFSAGADTLSITTGGTESVRFGAEASAVNYITMTASAAGQSPTISVAGTDTNIPLVVDSVGTSPIVFRTDGADKLKVWPGAIQVYAQIITQSGSATSPSYSFSSDANSGMFSDSDDVIGFSANGTGRFYLTSSEFFAANNAGPSLKNTAGTATSPTILPDRSRTDVGISSPAGDQMSVVAGGAESVRFLTETSAVNYLALRGSATGVPVQIEAAGTDTDVGIRLEAKGSSGFVSNMVGGNTKFVSYDTNNRSFQQMLTVDGSASAPGYAFGSDTNTGIYRVGENVLGLSAAAGVRAVIDATGLIVGGASGTTARTDTEVLSVKGDGGVKIRSSDDLHVLEGVYGSSIWYWGTDTDTDLIFRRNNTNGLALADGYIRTYQQIRSAANGTAALPDYTFNTDSNTGIYSPASDQLAVSSGGSQVMLFHNSVNRGLVKFQSVDGSNSAPSYGFTNDADTGIYLTGTGSLGFSTGGVLTMYVDSAGLKANNSAGPLFANEAASGTNPTLIPNRADINTGVGSASTDTLSLIAGGVESLRLTDSSVLFQDGTVSVPGVAFLSDTNTGVYRIGNDQLGFSAGGVLGLQINNGEVIIPGNLTVSGTTTTVNTTEVNIADNIMILNSDVTGTPSENSGIEIERGTSTNATMIWNETTDQWEAGLSGSETQIALFDTNGDLDAERDIHIKSTNSVHFGGSGAASSDSKYTIEYNSGTDSLDFRYVN